MRRGNADAAEGRNDRNDGAVRIEMYLVHADRSVLVKIRRIVIVVVEEIPLTLELYDRMVSGPSHNRIEYHTLIGERSVRIVANTIAEVVGVTSRI